MRDLKTNDELIQGIKLILSKDRYSFTDEERVLLQESLLKLESLRNGKGKIDYHLVADIISLILQAFSIYKDIFL